MDKPTIELIGHKLRKEFKAPDALPYPMRMALAALARKPLSPGANDNDVQLLDASQATYRERDEGERR
jgi:hypothetical protein